MLQINGKSSLLLWEKFPVLDDYDDTLSCVNEDKASLYQKKRDKESQRNFVNNKEDSCENNMKILE